MSVHEGSNGELVRADDRDGRRIDGTLDRRVHQPLETRHS